MVLAQIGALEVCLGERGSTEVAAFQIRLAEVTSLKVRQYQVGMVQVCSTEVHLTEITELEVGTGESNAVGRYSQALPALAVDGPLNNEWCRPRRSRS